MAMARGAAGRVLHDFILNFAELLRTKDLITIVPVPPPIGEECVIVFRLLYILLRSFQQSHAKRSVQCRALRRSPALCRLFLFDDL